MNDWKESMKRGGRRLAEEFEKNPVAVIGVCGLAMASAAKLTQAGTEVYKAHIWKKEVSRRAMNTAMKVGKKNARYPFS